MKDVVLFFEVHQPYRLDRRLHEKLIEKSLRGTLTPKDLEEVLLDQGLNKLVMERASSKCYIPASKIMLENLRKFSRSDRVFKFSLGISGVFIEQARMWAPQVLQLFQDMVATGLVEVVAQTYYHSLAAFIPPDFTEFRRQFEEHLRLIKELFGAIPTSAENTEFIYNNDIGCELQSMGFKVVLTEGTEKVLGWRSPNYVYRAFLCDIRVLVRNYRLSDDVGFRFTSRWWDQYPLTADKYALWLASTPGDVILLAMDYETFGEHHWPESGIHEFLRWLPQEVLKHPHLRFSTPTDAAFSHDVRDFIDVPPWGTISWADERDLSAWLGNSMQRRAFEDLLSLKPYVDAVGNEELLRVWKLLTISDHFYYMATKFGSFDEVHTYFSPYKNSVEAYAIFMKAVAALAEALAYEISRNPRAVAAKLVLPPEKAFHFQGADGRTLGLMASSLRQLYEVLQVVPGSSLIHHVRRGDLQRWLREVLMLEDLASSIDEVARGCEDAEGVRSAVLRLLSEFLGG